MTQTMNKQETKAIDNHQDFNSALLEKQAGIVDDPNPYLEVSEKFFKALSKGRDLRSMTYGDPGVRIYRIGTKEEIDLEEKMPADKFREIELKRASNK